MSKATIAYFEGRARVEPIRVILEELAIPYEDERVSFETWVKMKGETPFGALPSYRKGDMEIFQSHAIIRHLARVHDLYGSTEVERVRCDVIEEAISDLTELVGKAPGRPNFASERADYVANELRPALERSRGGGAPVRRLPRARHERSEKRASGGRARQASGLLGGARVPDARQMRDTQLAHVLPRAPTRCRPDR